MSDIGNLRAVEATTDTETVAGKLSRGARKLAEFGTDAAPLIGYITIGVYADGGYSCGFQTPEDHPFLGPTMFAAYIREIIARELTGKMAADDYAREMGL